MWSRDGDEENGFVPPDCTHTCVWYNLKKPKRPSWDSDLDLGERNCGQKTLPAPSRFTSTC